MTTYVKTILISIKIFVEVSIVAEFPRITGPCLVPSYVFGQQLPFAVKEDSLMRV